MAGRDKAADRERASERLRTTLAPEVGAPDLPEPTRRALMLRRRAANRSRLLGGRAARPELKAGACDACSGWGAIGRAGTRCPRCGGRG